MATILITGVTSGIGFALTKAFAQRGDIVIGCGRDPHKIMSIQKEFRSPHLFQTVDVSDANAVSLWAQSIYQQFPTIDIIINNAGVKNKIAPLWEISTQDFQQVMDINVTGPFNIIKNFVPCMIEHNQGVIINFSSEWGRVTDAKVAPYCASKFAIEGLTQALAKELPSKMIAVTVSPFIVFTSLLEACKELLLPGEYEAGISPEAWANFVIPKIFELTLADNGKAFTWHPNATCS
jgi:NAD(P)-dependent dehydrogenase (short-subunit alcohol dehydrogenase family)